MRLSSVKLLLGNSIGALNDNGIMDVKGDDDIVLLMMIMVPVWP